MPHIIVEKLNPPEANSTIDGVEVLFVTTGKFPIFGVVADEKRFLLKTQPHKNGTILKAVKSTRVPVLGTIKKALVAVAKNSKTLSSTIDSTTSRDYDYLVEADYFADQFDYQKPLSIEVGFGSGRHILMQAQSDKETTFLGLEVHKPSAEQLLRRIVHEKIENILVCASDARIVLKSVATSSVSDIFVHFPVPWDDAPHRRVISEEFVLEAMRVLKQNGTLHLRTDSKEYFDFAHKIAQNIPLISYKSLINSEGIISSKYEDRWKKQQKDIYDLFITKERSDDFAKIWYDFGFDKIENLQLTLKNLENHTTKKDRFLLKIASSFDTTDGNKLFEIVLGSFNAPQNIYLLISQNSASYFPNQPIFSQENLSAHNELKSLIV